MNPWVIVLAAGDGSRLRGCAPTVDGFPVPKQFCSVDGELTLLERTIERARRLTSDDRIVVVVAERHRPFWSRDLAILPLENVVVQPANRGTAPGLLLPLLHALSRDSLAPVVVLPSDHHVLDERVLQQSIESALDGTRHGRLVVLGITPESPEPDYGWIVPAPAEAPSPTMPAPPGLRGVTSFVEKPDPDTAARLKSEGALWNSFILTGAPSSLLAVYNHAATWLLRIFLASEVVDIGPEDLARLYATIPPADFSRDILQRSSEHLAVLGVPACGWSDLGTPGRLASHRARRPAPQPSRKDVMLLGC